MKRDPFTHRPNTAWAVTTYGGATRRLLLSPGKDEIFVSQWATRWGRSGQGQVSGQLSSHTGTQPRQPLQMHQGWGRWGQHRATAEEKSTAEKVLTFTSSSISKLVLLKYIHRLQQNFLICQTLEITWAELRDWETTCQHYPPTKYCVKTRKKIPFRKPYLKRTRSQHKRDRTVICCRMATLGDPIQHPLSDCCSHHIQSHFN